MRKEGERETGIKGMEDQTNKSILKAGEAGKELVKSETSTTECQAGEEGIDTRMQVRSFRVL